MAVIETWYNQDLAEPVKVHYIDGNVFSQDNDGNLIGVNVFYHGQVENLNGSASASVIRADGATVAVAGTITGNKAYVQLPQACYSVPGVISVALKITNGGTITTICAVVANVYQTATDAIVDPGTIIPSISALIASIDAAVASIPADYSALSNEVRLKAIINDLAETSFIPASFPLDQTGVVTTGKAWKTDGTEVAGSQYEYITYNIPASYAGNIAIVYGHGWGNPYPVVSFYTSNMTLIATAGTRGDTQYRGLPVIIPTNTATIVINARSNEAFPVGIAFYTITDFVGALKKVGTYGRTIDSSVITEFPAYADVKNLPTNCVYSLGASLWSSMTNLPNELNTYATIIKVNGANSNQLVGGGAYNLYICANEYNLWIGFENNDALVWRLISGTATPATKYLLIGDSYGDGYSHDGNNSGWCEYFAQAMGLTSSQYEAKHQGGSGFANGGFLARLNSATGTGFTDVIVLGGFNDYNATAQSIDSAISTFCNRAKALFPKCNIHIGCVGWIKQGTGESAYDNWQAVRAEITGKVLPTYQSCAKYGAQYIAFSEYLLNDSLMTNTDGYHPGEAGNKAIAHGIMNATKTGVSCLPFKSILK